MGMTGDRGTATKEYGYKKLVVWWNAQQLRALVWRMTIRFPKSEMRRVSQMRDAARSVKQNIQEGYRRSLGQYIQFLVISDASLAELSGDIEDCSEDGLISQEEFSLLNELCAKTHYLFTRLIASLRKKRYG